MTISQAYSEEEERREAEEKRRNEAQALNRWYQLLSSIVVRQRLNNRYGDGLVSHAPHEISENNVESDAQVGDGANERQMSEFKPKNVHDSKHDAPNWAPTRDHEHVFLTEDQIVDEQSSTRTKRCRCGFSVEVEEL